MDYREHAKDLLSRKKNLTSAYAAIKSELDSLEQEKAVCKSSLAQQQSDACEERLINILVDMEDCRFRKNIVERDLQKIEKGIFSLSDYHRDIIEEFFFERSPDAAEILMERWYKERSTIYRDRTRAVEEFTRSVYGVVQI